MIDPIVLKNFIKGRRDHYISTIGKLNAKSFAMQEILIKINEMDDSIVTSDDLICEGLE